MNSVNPTTPHVFLLTVSLHKILFSFIIASAAPSGLKHIYSASAQECFWAHMYFLRCFRPLKSSQLSKSRLWICRGDCAQSRACFFSPYLSIEPYCILNEELLECEFKTSASGGTNHSLSTHEFILLSSGRALLGRYRPWVTTFIWVRRWDFQLEIV